MPFRGCLRLLPALALAAMALALPARADHLSPLAPKPDWDSLEPYQKTITREEFTRLVNNVYSIDGALWASCAVPPGRCRSDSRPVMVIQ